MSARRDVNEKKKKKGSWVSLVVMIGLAACVRLFLLTPVVVEGESMLPTLNTGDRLLVNQISHIIGEPERHSIVVFNVDEDKRYIKRIVGIPGDSIIYTNKTLYINGEPQDEHYLQEGDITSVTEDFTLNELTGSDTVPEGHIFVLGDNRQNSTDSRTIGLVPMDSIVGSSNFVFWSDNKERIGVVEPLKK